MGKKDKNKKLIDEKIDIPVSSDEEKSEKKSRISSITCVFIFILIYSLFSHFYQLDYKAYHHDEGIHAYYSWTLSTNGPGSYKYDPVYHGPFLYFADAFIFRICGFLRTSVANDFNARFVPALFGIFLIILLYRLKRVIDPKTAIIITLLGTMSPTLTYFARFLRHDIYISVYTLGMILCFLLYWREKNGDYLYYSFALAALSFVTKEDTYIVLFIFFSYFLFYTLLEYADNVIKEEKDINMYLECSFPEIFMKNKKLALSILFLTTVTLKPIDFLVHNRSCEEKKTEPLSVITFINNIKADMTSFLNAIFIFVVIYTVFFTSFFFNPKGLFTGMFGFFSYWVFDQQIKQPRIPGPFYYYVSKLCVYEFTILIFAIFAIWYFLSKKDRITPLVFYSSLVLIYIYSFYKDYYYFMSQKYVLYTACAIGFFYVLWGIMRMIYFLMNKSNFLSFVIYWSLSSLFIYSYAQEKVPWLMTHIVLPFTVLAGLCIGDILKSGKKFSRYVTIAILLVLVPYNFYVSYRVNFIYPDDPREPMVYTQTTRDVVNTSNKIREIVKELEEKNKGDKKSYTIYVDNEVSWPFVWYLKNYTVSYSLPSSSADAKNAIAVLSSIEKQNSVETYLSGNFSRERYKLRGWWLADNVKFFDLMKNNQKEFLTILSDFIFYRKLWNATGSTDYMLYIRKDFSNLPVIENISPVKLHNIETRPVKMTPSILGAVNIGNKGKGIGQFMSPRDIDVDPQGNIYVVDSFNHRIQKFSDKGKFITTWGKEGGKDGEFEQPCGICVDGKKQCLFVADTWNHRICRFSLNGDFELSWSGDFYGPRDIAIDGNGDVYVTDTGNCLIKKYNSDGKLLSQFGSKGSGDGQFQEPVGLLINKEGQVIVADTWNQRLQFFNSDGKFLNKFNISGWYGDSIKEPYMVIDEKGDLILTDSSLERLMVYNQKGELKGIYKTGAVNPVGIALYNNKLITGDFASGFIQIIDWKN